MILKTKFLESANAKFSNKSVTYIMWIKPQETSGGLLMTTKLRKKDSPSQVKISLKKGILGAAVKRKTVLAKNVCQLPVDASEVKE